MVKGSGPALGVVREGVWLWVRPGAGPGPYPRPAVLLDRDGVINAMCPIPETGGVDSPATPEQWHLLPGAGEAVARLNSLGLPVVVVSNQPGVAKGRFTLANLEATTRKMLGALEARGAHLEAVLYCLHHPQGVDPRLSRDCPCRKPRPGLLQEAARLLNLDLPRSCMVGDSPRDVQAGAVAGCYTLWVGTGPFPAGEGPRPNAQAPDLARAVRIIAGLLSPSRGERCL